MGRGRGSAAPTVAIAVTLLVCLLIKLEHANVNAAVYTVGGPSGWTYNTDTWPNGRRFRGGDVLIFKYDPTSHNVVAVDRNGYESCSAPGGAKVFRSGKDQIQIARGLNYFICNYPGHCQSGMKIAINAL